MLDRAVAYFRAAELAWGRSTQPLGAAREFAANGTAEPDARRNAAHSLTCTAARRWLRTFGGTTASHIMTNI